MMKVEQIQLSDEELRVMLEAGFVLREANRLDEAEKIFQGVAELLPRSDVPRVALGSIALRRGRFGEAQAVCEEALLVSPDSLYARVHRAEALLFQQKRSEAEAELNEVMTIDPSSPHSRTAKALLDAADLISPRQAVVGAERRIER